jgi:adenylosuccinate lyase
MLAWREEKNFRELVAADPEITSRVKKKTLDRAFDLNRQLRNVDKIFRRVFGKVNSARTAGRSVSSPRAKKRG